MTPHDTFVRATRGSLRASGWDADHWHPGARPQHLSRPRWRRWCRHVRMDLRRRRQGCRPRTQIGEEVLCAAP
jgi:hypothetical protein